MGMNTGTPADVVKAAMSEVGYDEGRGNLTKFAAEAGHTNGQAWCATFVAAILKRCHIPVPASVLSPSSRTMFAEAKKAGYGVSLTQLRRGDVIHTWRGFAIGAWLGHVGIVVGSTFKVDGRGRVKLTSVTTVEGNTDRAGSATGGSVLKKTRMAGFWRLGAWRPPYDEA